LILQNISFLIALQHFFISFFNWSALRNALDRLENLFPVIKEKQLKTTIDNKNQ